MSVQDNTEQVLRKIHILLSQSEVYDEATGTVIVEKQELLGLLQELNLCMYGMMEEYELTQQGKDKVERDTRKVGEAIIRDARHTAEDVYAASVMYTDEALRRAMDIVDETMESLRDSFRRMEKDLQSKKDAIAGNKLELKSQLQDLKDTDKYLQLIEERNKQIEKEKNEEQEAEVSPTAHIKPEIKINKDYFERNGIPIEEDAPQKDEQALGGRQKKAASAEKPGHSAYEENLDAEMQELEGILKEGMKEENARAKTPGGEMVDVDALADKIAAQAVMDFGQEEFADETRPPLVAQSAEDEVYDYGDEPEMKVTPEIRVNLDAEYFKWKENMEIEDFGEGEKTDPTEKTKKPGRFSRKK